jgi:hypothetical protein
MGSAATTSRRLHRLVLLCCALTLALPQPASAQAKTLKLIHTETTFGRLPAGARADQLFFSPDARHAAAVVKQKGGAAVWIDGVEGKLHEWVLPHSLVWSPDCARLAYNVQRGDSLLVVIGTDEQPPFADVSSITFGPGGMRYAYTAKPTAQSAGVAVILDGVQGKEYPAINARSLTFSPDGRRFAFRVETGSKQFWVVDGVERPEHDRVGVLAFSDDGSRFGYSAEIYDRQSIVTDQPTPPAKGYDAAGGLAFSVGGKRMAFAARRDNREFVVIDGVEGKEYDRVAEPMFNARGTRVVYEAVRDKRAMVVVDGQEQTGYDAISEARFSGDGEHIGYRAVRDGRFHLVIDGRESDAYDRIGAWHMNDDATRIAFAARHGADEFLVLDGQRLPGAGHVTMAPGGRFIAHSRTDGKMAVLMVNEADGNAYDGFLAGARWVFHSPTTFTCLAGRKGEIVRVDVEIVQE